MKRKIINIYNGFFEGASQGGGIKYVKSLVELQSRYAENIYVLCCSSDSSNLPRALNSDITRYISISHYSTWPLFLLRIFWFALLNRSFFDNSTIHIHRSYFAIPFALLRIKTEIIFTIHTTTFLVFETSFPFFKFLIPVFKYIELYILRNWITAITTAGKYGSELYYSRYPKFNKKILHLPISSSITTASSKSTCCISTSKVILCSGRLATVKRPLSVLDLFAQLHAKYPELAVKYKLVFAGDGPLKHELTVAASKLPNNINVSILGAIPSNQMDQIYAEADNLILLSISEVSPFVVKEAISYGIPVFATDVGDVKQVLPPSAGYIISPELPMNLVEHFRYFLQKEYNSDTIRDWSHQLMHIESQTQESTLRAIYTHYS